MPFTPNEKWDQFLEYLQIPNSALKLCSRAEIIIKWIEPQSALLWTSDKPQLFFHLVDNLVTIFLVEHLLCNKNKHFEFVDLVLFLRGIGAG